MRNLALALALIAALESVLAAAAAQRSLAPEASCKLGAYRSKTGDILAIMPSQAGPRYIFLDGRRGGVQDDGSLVTCHANAVAVSDGGAARREIWDFVPLRTTSTKFQSGEATLSGVLIEYPKQEAKPPLIVLGHGSERTGSIGRTRYATLLAGQGISVFVYDKRGTGESGGRFSSNIEVLARDMVAASAEAKRLAKGRFSRFGLVGGSQAGWVVPRASRDAGAQFLAISYGGIFSPVEEDREGVLDQLRARGYGEDIIQKGRELTEIATEIMLSNGARGFDKLERFKAAHGAKPWFRELKPDDYTSQVLTTPEAELRRILSAVDRETSIDLAYDPMRVLRELSVPTLWVLAARDRMSPGRLTQDRLLQLQAEGKPITLAIFPNTDHGMLEFVEQPDGSRTYTRYAKGYFRLLGDWVLGRVSSLPN